MSDLHPVREFLYWLAVSWALVAWLTGLAILAEWLWRHGLAKLTERRRDR